MKVIVPPIKCQGIKTKLVPTIRQLVPEHIEGRWIEPFCGSGVVALNIRPERTLLADANQHIITLYRAIQGGSITPTSVRAYLQSAGDALAHQGEAYYYHVRTRFNSEHDPLDFLFLSRACFNGVMRFNQRGNFNVPFCRKPERFSPAYITKIVNQVRAFSTLVQGKPWRFAVIDFDATLAQAAPGDFVYVDPPYAGRHVDYYNSWRAPDEARLVAALKALPCPFLLSTWHSNKYRANDDITSHWATAGFYITTVEHFYHVGPTEDLRNGMTEALITNYPLPATFGERQQPREEVVEQYSLHFG